MFFTFCFTFLFAEAMIKVKHFKQDSSENKFVLPYIPILYPKMCLLKFPLRKAVVYAKQIK